MNTTNTFIFNLEWFDVLSEYPAEVRFEVYEAIMRYAASGTLSELKPLAKMAFSFIKKDMDCNRQKYEATVERRRNASKIAVEARKNRNQSLSNVTNRNESLSNVTYNDNDNDYYNDNDIKKNKIKKSNSLKVSVKEFPEVNNTNLPAPGPEAEFEKFRQLYPGRKRGFRPELDNFKKKFENWNSIIPLLLPAVKRMIEFSECSRAAGQFTPEYKNLSTWINNQCWTEEYPVVTPPAAAKVPAETESQTSSDFSFHGGFGSIDT